MICCNVLYISMRKLIRIYSVPFLKSEYELKSLKKLSIELLNNSSLFLKMLYISNAIFILIIDLLPKSISKIFYKFFLNPQFNPLTKATLFYIYHHAF